MKCDTCYWQSDICLMGLEPDDDCPHYIAREEIESDEEEEDEEEEGNENEQRKAATSGNRL